MGNPVSTFGWDTAYVAPFSVVNAAITSQQSYPKTFNYLDETQITINGNWTSWQLTPGGAGADVQMVCTITSGTASGAGQNGDLTGASVTIQVNLKDVAATDPVNDPTSKPNTGTSRALVVNTGPVGNDPAVSIISSSYPNVSSVLLRDLLDSIFKNYFNANISQFNNVFAVMDLNAVADKDGFQWLKPHRFSYAVATAEDGSLENSVFGLLAMIDNNEISPTMQQAVDVNALQNLATGANSAFVISETLVAQKMLFNGALSTIQGSSAADFGFSEDGLSVVNVNDVTWGNFQTSNGIISPTISKNNFTLRADDTSVLLEIIDAQYENSPGVTVHMNITQRFTYNTVKAQNGNYVFIPDTSDLGNAQVSTTVSLSKGLQITQIVMGVVAAVAGLLCAASAVASCMAGAADVAVNAGANAAAVGMDGAAAAEQAGAAAVEEENAAGAVAADAGAAAPGQAGLVQNCGLLASTQFRAATGLIGAIAGITSGSIMIAKAITEGRYNDIPAFDDFAANCMGASIWPGLTNYTLVDASFRSSLVMAVALNTK